MISENKCLALTFPIPHLLSFENCNLKGSFPPCLPQPSHTNTHTHTHTHTHPQTNRQTYTQIENYDLISMGLTWTKFRGQTFLTGYTRPEHFILVCQKISDPLNFWSEVSDPLFFQAKISDPLRLLRPHKFSGMNFRPLKAVSGPLNLVVQTPISS